MPNKFGDHSRNFDITIDKIDRMTYWDKINKIGKPSTNININNEIYEIIDQCIPKPICRKRLRYGHVDNICRSCNNCSEDTHDDSPISRGLWMQVTAHGPALLNTHSAKLTNTHLQLHLPIHKKNKSKSKKQMITKHIDYNEAKLLHVKRQRNKPNATDRVATSLWQEYDFFKHKEDALGGVGWPAPRLIPPPTKNKAVAQGGVG